MGSGASKKDCRSETSTEGDFNGKRVEVPPLRSRLRTHLGKQKEPKDRCHPLVPQQPIHGDDVAEHKNASAWSVNSWRFDAKIRAPAGTPLPPDRRSHEAHLRKLHLFRREVRTAPEVITAVVEIKRDEHERFQRRPTGRPSRRPTLS